MVLILDSDDNFTCYTVDTCIYWDQDFQTYEVNIDVNDDNDSGDDVKSPPYKPDCIDQ
jgi:hypothetical protein